MSPPSPETLELAAELQRELAGSSLVPAHAKLYSQHTRLRARRPGLSGWGRGEALARLEDACRLLEAGLVQRAAGDEGYRSGLRRAGELLEWLSHPLLNPERLPLRLLSAATYQLAGYPARANALLREPAEDGTESAILRAYLRGDLPVALAQLVSFWSSPEGRSGTSNGSASAAESEAALQRRVFQETTGALGVICAAMRWGDEPRLTQVSNHLQIVGRLLLHSAGHYSWLLAKLCAEVAGEYAARSMRSILREFGNQLSPDGLSAIERYLRQAYVGCRTLAWPSQAQGIQRLQQRGSFALCTPTGSGKTTIAELAILQSLFQQTAEGEEDEPEASRPAPLTLYLVPSRALAAEVEGKLSRVLRRLSGGRVVVTGLYGGTDWGPTDAWLTSEDPTVLICTYEKAEALMRFLGPLFLPRLNLLVIDEAHSIQWDNNRASLLAAENRPLRLEALAMRLFAYADMNRCRIVALSAVAASTEDALSAWVTGMPGELPVRSDYRSTRQLIGRLACNRNGTFEIRYDLLDGSSLQFGARAAPDATPYVPSPFPPRPPARGWDNGGPEKRLRPGLLWAAIHLAAPDEFGHRHPVLISITEQPRHYAEDFLRLLESEWSSVQLPSFFAEPAGAEERRTWERCRLSCEDYLGRDSPEYRLLLKGIVVHHGKMPGLTARLLVEAVQMGIASIVIATSTLSEGVNLPIETILIPTLRRLGGQMDAREFRNLIGRAGRPGFGTEGRALVLMSEDSTIRWRYETLLHALSSTQPAGVATSPLAQLLTEIWTHWQEMASSSSQQAFLDWLEETAPLDFAVEGDDSGAPAAVRSLDTLDGLLLAAVVELEQAMQESSPGEAEVEDRLRRVWRRSFAAVAATTQQWMQTAFLRRGEALHSTIYPDPNRRRNLYRTSLPPRSANQFIHLYPSIRQSMAAGTEYASWEPAEKLRFITGVVAEIGRVPRFRCEDLVNGRNRTPWQDVLAWWLAPRHAAEQPDPRRVSDWYSHASRNFVYRFNWGLGSFISLAVDEAHEGLLAPTRLEEWPQTGLPWIAFWLKELITWGTLEPAATYLLAKGRADTRRAAEALARQYFDHILSTKPRVSADDMLNAAWIRDWMEQQISPIPEPRQPRPPREMPVELTADFGGQVSRRWRVLPAKDHDELVWFDPGGFPFARCSVPEHGWDETFLSRYDFWLNVDRARVIARRYL
jgi:hypothetical protein